MKRTAGGRGRPPLDPKDPSKQITIRLPGTKLDDYCKRALREGVSVPEVIRRDLEKKTNK